MIFSNLAMNDYRGIAMMERRRRWIETGKAGWDDARRSAADDGWEAICDFEFHLVEIRPVEDRADTLDRKERLRLADVTMRIAIAAVRRHRDQGYPAGEAEAHAYKLLQLARRMAYCTGTPYPCVGEILTSDISEAAA